EALLVEQLIERVAGDASRDLRESRSDQVLVSIPEVFQLRVYLTAPSALADDSLQLVRGRGSDTHAESVIREDLQLVQVVRRTRAGAIELRQDRVRAARVVADHAAERAAVVRRGVRSEGQAVIALGGASQVVEDGAR